MSALRSILDDKHNPVQYVGPEATAHDAVAKMCEHHIGALLVEEHDEPIGIISERDIMTRLVLEHRDPTKTADSLGKALRKHLGALVGMTPDKLIEDRYRKFRALGPYSGR